MYKNILVAVHGEEKEGFDTEVTELIRLFKPKVTVIHVTETDLTHYGYVDQLASAITKDQFIDYIHNMADSKKKAIYQRFDNLTKELEIEMGWKVRGGKAAEIIASEARHGKYDLLLLGTKPKSPGNTSSKVKEQVVKDLQTSLLIIK